MDKAWLQTVWQWVFMSMLSTVVNGNTGLTWYILSLYHYQRFLGVFHLVHSAGIICSSTMNKA
jgi:hypothetical protein